MGALGLIGRIIGIVADKLIGPVFTYLNRQQDVSLERFKTMTAAERAEYADYLKALGESNAAKVQRSVGPGAHAMVYLFGLPAALHWAAVFGITTFPSLFHWFGIESIAALPERYANAELTIALSFFILAPTLPLVSTISNVINKRR